MIQQGRILNYRVLSFAFRIENTDIQCFRIANPKEQKVFFFHLHFFFPFFLFRFSICFLLYFGLLSHYFPLHFL